MAKNSFTNAFIRQLGRECAHTAYTEAMSYGSDVKSIDSAPMVQKLEWFRLVLDFFIGLLIPFIVLAPIIRGIKRINGNVLNGQVLATIRNYKEDRRYRGGIKYLGDSQTLLDVQLPRENYSEEELEKAGRRGMIELLYSAAFIIFYVWFAISAGIF